MRIGSIIRVAFCWWRARLPLRVHPEARLGTTLEGRQDGFRPAARLALRVQSGNYLLVNQRATEHLRADPVMAGLIDRVGPVRLRPRRLPPFHALTHAIIHQQLSGKAAGSILGRFLALFDHEGFPTPQAVLKASPELLRSAGLSRPKINYILGMALHAADGAIPSLAKCDNMTDAELLECFTQIRGIGRWTVEMLLIFNLGRPDVLPIHDLGVRKGFQFAYRKRKLPAPEKLERFGVRWAPYRTTAAWYLWRAADFLNGNGWS